MVNTPSTEAILRYFNSLEEAYNMAMDMLLHVSEEDVEKYSLSEKVKEQRIKSNVFTKKNSMCKIGKQILNRNLPFDKESYNSIKKETHSKAPIWDNMNKYFNSLDEFKELSEVYNHSVKSVEIIELESPIPMYDISVEKYHNFIVDIYDNCNTKSSKLFGGVDLHNSDRDSDGEHICTLLLTFMYRFMRPLIEQGHVYCACPPLYKVKYLKDERYLYSKKELDEFLKKKDMKNVHIQRYKGLGEMMPQQLYDTTMDSKKRMLKQVTIDDVQLADEVFTL